MGAHAIDVGLADFQHKVLDESLTRPVVVDFWAPWCGPCRSLKPILEKLADEYAGKFLLAKVNADENPDLSAQFGVRGIPAVKAVVGGKIVDEFSGAQPETAVREFLDRILPSPTELMRADAQARLEAGDTAGALQTLADAARLDPANTAVRIDVASIMLDLDEPDETRRLLEGLSPLTTPDPRLPRLLARLQFASEEANAAEGADTGEAALTARIDANGDDLDARLALARLLAARGEHAAALDQALEIVRRDREWNEQAGRRTMLSIFDLLGGQGEVVSRYRRLLSSALN